MNDYSDGDKISLFDLEDRLVSSCEKVKDQPAVIFKQSSLVLNESSSSTVGKRKSTHDSDKPIDDKSPKTKKIKDDSITPTTSSSSKEKRMKSPNVNEDDEVFIEDIDLQDELVTIRNPSSSSRDLSGWKISDDHGRNKFVIPEGTKVDPKGILNIYCCAKGHKGAAAASVAGNAGETSASLKKPYIFWTNKDGTPRMKNVLNDGRLHMLLINLY